MQTSYPVNMKMYLYSRNFELHKGRFMKLLKPELLNANAAEQLCVPKHADSYHPLRRVLR